MLNVIAEFRHLTLFQLAVFSFRFYPDDVPFGEVVLTFVGMGILLVVSLLLFLPLLHLEMPIPPVSGEKTHCVYH